MTPDREHNEYSQVDDSDHRVRLSTLLAEGKGDRAIARQLSEETGEHITRNWVRTNALKLAGNRAPAIVKPGDLSHYDMGCRALAQAKTLEEVLDVHDKAAAMAEYFRRANERAPLMDLLELRTDAARRFGEMVGETKAAIGLAKGGRPAKEPVPTSEQVSPKLADLGTTRKFSSYAQKIAALPEREYKKRKAQWRAASEASPKVPPYDPLKPDPAERRETRRAEMRDLAANPLLLPEGPFAAGIADPPWEDPDAPIGQTGRHYRDHYPTMTPQEIGALMVADIFAPTAFLALWITDHHLLIGSHLVVLSSWGFKPCSLVTWDKVTLGMGQGFTRNRTEHLVLAKRGLPAVPDAPERVDSLLTIKRTSVHSEKPENPYGWIETWFPEMSYVELFARVLKPGEAPRPGWATWGNQAQNPAQTEAAE